MNRSRIALLAILATAFVAPNVPRAQAAKANVAATPASSNATATTKLLAKMLKLISLMGADRDIPPPIAGALGLAATGEAWPDRQFAFEWKPSATLHAVAISRGADPDIVLSVRGPAAVSVYRAHRDGTLVSATNFFLETKQIATLSPAEARAGFSRECAFWAAHIDALESED